jgi:hypothetical protein
MKRPPPSFVVEVRKQRRPPGESAKSWYEEPPPTPATPASLAVFAEPAPAEAAPSRPAGRILQSLVEPALAPDLGEPSAIKPRRAKTAEAERLPAYKRPSGGKKPLDYKKMLAKIREPRHVEPPPAPPPQLIQAAAPVASESRQPARAERHARILKRYVHRGEPKAGERWKRRLQRSER